MNIRSEIKIIDNINDYETIAMLAETLIEKLEKNKLKKADRELLVSAVNIVYEIRSNQEIQGE